ncbi:helix-turn-helix domain-containing protein [Streptomyces sp. NPDC029006]|uniref:helix-turn-helix transcriptional regulator n=1 Tax=Streptomyces sp. NPDC029006 TaxID=3155467 RepID=UPI0033C6A3BB
METTETAHAVEAGHDGLLSTPAARYLRVKEIAIYFGVALSTIYQAIETGDLPAIAIGRGSKKAIRVHEDDFRAFETRCRVQPNAEPIAA